MTKDNFKIDGCEYEFVEEPRPQKKLIAIYGLVSSGGECFYVGRSVNPLSRLWAHRGNKAFLPFAPFRMALFIKVETDHEALFAEKETIEYMKRCGCRLMNQAEPCIPHKRSPPSERSERPL